jgi:hypothetical protein
MDPSRSQPQVPSPGLLPTAGGMAPRPGYRRRDGASVRPSQKNSIAAVITDGTPSP